jgi:hypothetical protein
LCQLLGKAALGARAGGKLQTLTLSSGETISAGTFVFAAGPPILNAHVCQSDNTVDGNFIIDRHPGLDNVWLVGGGSYHGFKMGPVAGDYIAQRVVGRDRNPELAAIFKIKAETFAESGPTPRPPDWLE